MPGVLDGVKTEEDTNRLQTRMGAPGAVAGEQRSRSPGALAAVVVCVGLTATLLVRNEASPSTLISLSPPVVYTPASKLQDYSIQIPSTWKPGTKLGVKVSFVKSRDYLRLRDELLTEGPGTAAEQGAEA